MWKNELGSVQNRLSNWIFLIELSNQDSVERKRFIHYQEVSFSVADPISFPIIWENHSSIINGTVTTTIRPLFSIKVSQWLGSIKFEIVLIECNYNLNYVP